METLATIIQLDFKDAYCSIPIYEPDKKCFKFEYKSTLMVLPNGDIEGPRKFTKLLKLHCYYQGNLKKYL